MIRYFLTLLTWIALVSLAPAMVTPHKEFSLPREKGGHLLVKSFAVFDRNSAYRITEKSEIRLDGRKCEYQEVPDTAKIILMEIDSEANRVILRIHFQNRK